MNLGVLMARARTRLILFELIFNLNQIKSTRERAYLRSARLDFEHDSLH